MTTVFLLLGACGSAPGESLVADQALVDLGCVDATKDRSVAWILRNATTSPIALREARASCACLHLEFTPGARVLPGTPFELQGILRASPSTAIEVTVVVGFEGGASGDLHLAVRAVGTSPLRISLDSEGLRLEPGPKQTSQIRVGLTAFGTADLSNIEIRGSRMNGTPLATDIIWEGPVTITSGSCQSMRRGTLVADLDVAGSNTRYEVLEFEAHAGALREKFEIPLPARSNDAYEVVPNPAWLGTHRVGAEGSAVLAIRRSDHAQFTLRVLRGAEGSNLAQDPAQGTPATEHHLTITTSILKPGPVCGRLELHARVPTDDSGETIVARFAGVGVPIQLPQAGGGR